MIQFQEILKKIILKDEIRFFHGLTFVVISLITIHLAIYFNFYKFSENWLELESSKTTFIISNNSDEKKIPLNITSNIEDYLSLNIENFKFKIIEDNLIKESLGLTNFSDMSGLKLPFIFQVETSNKNTVDEVYTTIINLSENRLIEKYSHQDELFEITSLVNRIKLIIFIMLLVVMILFSFLVMNIVKAALKSNYKLQIMGASSFELSKNISRSVVKKIIPGAILSTIFVYLISTLLIKLFGVNFNFFNSTFFLEINIKTLFLLILFISIFLAVLLVFLTSYLFYFFEKRFFDKF